MSLTRAHQSRLGTWITICLTLFLSGVTSAQAQTQTVKLKNGKTYEVNTHKGLPLNFKSDQIQITWMGFTGSTEKSEKMEYVWLMSAKLREKGRFVVTVTTPLDETISTTFECNGPGKISQTFLGSAEFPALWAWLDEPEPVTTWIPFVFSFVDQRSSKKFEATQWTQFDSATTRAMREQTKRMEELIRNSREPRKDQEVSRREEKLLVDFDGREWRVDYNVEQGSQQIKEYVLPGETVNNWTELVTIQVFPGAQKAWTAEKLMLNLRETTLNKCPKTKTMWNVLQKDENEVLYEWQTTDCRGMDNQYELAKIIRGRAAIHVARYTNKRLPIPDATRSQWLELIRKARLESGAPGS